MKYKRTNYLVININNSGSLSVKKQPFTFQLYNKPQVYIEFSMPSSILYHCNTSHYDRISVICYCRPTVIVDHVSC